MTLSCVSMLCLGFSQVSFVLTSPWLLAISPFLVFTIAYYLLSAWVSIGTRDFDFTRHQHLVRATAFLDSPTLDVFLPVCREPLDVLRNTWDGVRAMAKAHPGRCTVCVLDDGAQPEVQELAAYYGFRYLTRPETGDNPRGWFKKAGNLRHGFAHTTGDFILVLDADFTPRADLPQQLLPYMQADPKLGIVQSPQYFRVHSGQTRMERGAGAVQELFYRMVQVSRDQRDGAICVGSCAIYRRQALQANGGATLIGHSEDVHTGFDLRRQGWGVKYIPIPLAAGVCPDNPDAFFVQQYRWCMGSMSLLLSRKFWAHRMPLRTRACYLSGFCYYLHTAVFTIVTPVIPLVLLLAMPGHVKAVNYLFIAPSLVYNMLIFPLWHRCRYGPTAYMARLLYGWAHLFALAAMARRKPMGWKPTGAQSPGTRNRRLWAGVYGWSGGTTAVWISVAGYRAVTEGPRFLPMLALGLLTGWVVALAIVSRKEVNDHAA